MPTGWFVQGACQEGCWREDCSAESEPRGLEPRPSPRMNSAPVQCRGSSPTLDDGWEVAAVPSVSTSSIILRTPCQARGGGDVRYAERRPRIHGLQRFERRGLVQAAQSADSACATEPAAAAEEGSAGSGEPGTVSAGTVTPRGRFASASALRRLQHAGRVRGVHGLRLAPLRWPSVWPKNTALKDRTGWLLTSCPPLVDEKTSREWRPLLAALHSAVLFRPSDGDDAVISHGGDGVAHAVDAHAAL